MYFIHPMCCICLSSANHLKPLLSIDIQHLRYYLQLVASVTDLTYSEESEYNSVCDECCNNLKSVFDFCLKCLASRRQIEDYTSQLMVHSNQKGIPTVSLLNNFHMKPEVDIEPEVPQQEIGQLDITNIKEEIDIEDHKLLFPKSEPTEMVSSSIKSEHEQYSDVDEPVEVDLVGPCGDPGRCSDSSDAEKQINPGDETVKKIAGDKHTLLKTYSPGPTQKKFHHCTFCNKKFSRSSHLVIHLRIHTSEKPYGCTVCNKKFPKASYLIRLLRTHTEPNTNLKLHKRIHTNEKLFECTICDKKFSNPSNLKIHIRVHTGEKPYECTICDKKFSHSSEIAVHIRTHTGEKPYACTMCDKRFIRSSYLEHHLRVHTGEKPYACTICDKKFSYSPNLVTHLRTHTGEKPYACTLCSKKFPQSSNLVRHLRTHTGEKPYACTICDKKFSRSSNLEKHLRVHTGQKPYEYTV